MSSVLLSVAGEFSDVWNVSCPSAPLCATISMECQPKEHLEGMHKQT